ncbi:response regulator [Novosphingobium album (ex Liu et al. 2023)]|uniref:Response regulator n=1 Tax=Novosphingobium album (ex Liu et al. 2023) TaxID=3031130 RepID=A0ABT5WKH4_9SPHN|nr:response regulator [Novosphingobium album (ex Liu et al. 2023)]MDE8650521.1 response regulator [Novosphingobium album (ex Liu et al. 2023)]
MEEDGALVLVVDDVEAIVDELLTLLALQNIPAIGAHTLSEAIAALESAPAVSVIACDVRLDRETGLDIIPRIRDSRSLQARAFHYVFVTGDPMRLDLLPDMPRHSVLTKPVQPQALVRLLRELLAQAGA